MKLLTVCAVLSVLMTATLAGPVKTQIRDVADLSSSSESVEHSIVEDNKDKDSSSESDEEQPKMENIIKDEIKDDSSSEEEVVGKSKRSFRDTDYMANSNNHLKVKDEGSIKYEKYLKLKRLRRSFNSNNSDSSESDESSQHKGRFVRSAGKSSEEDSSEEDNKHKHSEHKHNAAHHEGHEHSAGPAEKPASAPAEGVVIAQKPDTAPAENVVLDAKPHTAPAESEPKAEEEHANAEASRRRRSLDAITVVSSDENISGQDQDVNEVFIFSNENQQTSEEIFKTETLKNNEYVVLNENDVNNVEKSLEVKGSDEDYAQGCGNHEDSTEHSNEDNETTYNEQ